MIISFRPMATDDLPLVSNWQMQPEVHRWYGKEYTDRTQIENRYLKELAEAPRRTWHYIIQLDGSDAGMIQTYLLDSYPEFSSMVQAGVGTAMVDIFLASDFMHKGHGSLVMKTFLREYVFSGILFTTDLCAIGPEPDNVSAIRMYEKTGFRWIKTIQIPSEDELEYIMIIHKDKLI